MKKRISLTLDEEIALLLDKMIDGLRVRSRSHAVEKILREHLLENKTAVIFAGGDPEKLWVAGLNAYRPLVEIDGKKLIEDIVLKVRSSGFRSIIIIGFPVIISKIYEVLGNGSKYGVNIRYIEETQERGSAKTLELAKDYVGSDFLFLPCDAFFDFDLNKLYQIHLQENGMVTLGVYTRTPFDHRSGVVLIEGYRIIDFQEKPAKPKTHTSSAFIGFMKREVFDYIPPGKVYWSLQENVFPKLAKEGKLVGYPVAGNWVNVHTKKDVERVINLIKKQK
jgi:NDP-sugar pyrophosphorylase family protein